ncbi:hypothetical protein D9M68_976980 [compost metagenome]
MGFVTFDLLQDMFERVAATRLKIVPGFVVVTIGLASIPACQRRAKHLGKGCTWISSGGQLADQRRMVGKVWLVASNHLLMVKFVEA